MGAESNGAIHRPARPPSAALAIAAGAVALQALAGPQGAPPPPAPDPGAQALLQKILDRTKALQGFSARFEQRLVPAGLPQPPPEKGRVFWRRPDRMRWEYETPERKIAVSDGAHGWLELTEERRVLTVNLEETLRDAPLQALLGGGREAAARFQALRREPRASDPPGLLRLALTPVPPSAAFDMLELGVAGDTLRLTDLEVVDPGGNRMIFTFRDISESPPPAESLFRYTPPAGFMVDSPQ